MDLPVPIHDILLVSLGLGLIVGGLGVVLLTNLIYFAFLLGLVLVCISLFYILSNSYFVAAVQLLIYVGAINVLILFAVMFMNDSKYYNYFHFWTVGDGFTSLVCTNIFFSLIATIPNTSNQVIEQDLTSNVQQIGIHLSTDFYLPFELISIILLVSLVGAIAMARRE
ncbi:unnamed protein product [Victoria cruziana]